MIQLRSRDTKAVQDLWISLQLLKYLCHRTSDPEPRQQTCKARPMIGDTTVYPCPVFDPAHLIIGRGPRVRVWYDCFLASFPNIPSTLLFYWFLLYAKLIFFNLDIVATEMAARTGQLTTLRVSSILLMSYLGTGYTMVCKKQDNTETRGSDNTVTAILEHCTVSQYDITVATSVINSIILVRCHNT